MTHISDSIITYYLTFHLALWLPSPSMSLQMTNLHSFGGLGSIPEFVYMYVYMYIHISLSIHLLMATYRFSFYALVIVNNAAVNTGMHASFQVSEVFYICTQEWDCHGICWFIFWESSILFFTMVATIYILNHSVQKFPLLHILTKIFFSFLFFLMTVLLPGMRWYFVVLLVCISLISNAKNCLCSPIHTWFG